MVQSHPRKRALSPPRPVSRRSGKTIKAAVDDFLLDRQSQNHSPQTLRWHTIALDHFVTFLEQHPRVTHLQDLETVHTCAWLVFLEKEVGPRGKVRAARTRRWYAQSVHAFCHWLHDEKYVEEDPAARVKLPKIEKPLIRIIEFEEFEALLSACAPREVVESCGKPRIVDIQIGQPTVHVSTTGVKLRVGDFDRKHGLLTVTGKGSKQRRIAVGTTCQRHLLHYLDRHRPNEKELAEWGSAGEDHLFLSETRTPLTKNGVEMLFKRVRERAGITYKRISPHILRHTFAIRYLVLGNDPFSLQEFLGHEDMATVKLYMAYLARTRKIQR